MRGGGLIKDSEKVFYIHTLFIPQSYPIHEYPYCVLICTNLACSSAIHLLGRTWLSADVIITKERYANKKNCVIFVCSRLLAQTTLRNILGTKNLHEILSDRESISGSMQVADSSKEHWMIYRGPGFLSFDSAHRRKPLPPSPVSKFSLFRSLPVCRRTSLLKWEKDKMGEEPNHTTARKPDPLLIIRYSLPSSHHLLYSKHGGYPSIF